MKKLLCLVLVGLLSLSPVAFADTITIDLDAASIEELETAKDAIDARIAELKAVTVAPADEMYITRGRGTQILNDFKEPSTVSRFVVTADSSFKVSYNQWSFDSNARCYIECFDHTDDIPQVMIETQGKWMIDYSPLEKAASPYMTGKGAYVTDYFTANTPQIVTFTIQCDGRYGGRGTSLTLYGIDSNKCINYIDRLITYEHISGIESFDVIIKQGYHKDIDFYFFAIDCPANASWSITEKR